MNYIYIKSVSSSTKKGGKITLGIVISLAIVALGLGVVQLIDVLMRDNDEDENEDDDVWVDPQFDNEGRYDDSILDYMTVIYESQSNIVAWNEGYSESTACPWGFVHQGLDFFLTNNSAVLAATPGKVTMIEYRDNGEGVYNRYWVAVRITFNETVELYYTFEPMTNETSDWENQKSMIAVQEGDWVEQGQEFARFLAVVGLAHIHFGVHENNTHCPQKYLSTDAYDELLSLVHSFHPTWDLCYP